MSEDTHTEPRWLPWLEIGAILLLLGVTYAPLLLWLGRTTVALDQLHNGGYIVLIALAINFHAARRGATRRPHLNDAGLVLIFAASLTLIAAKYLPAYALPLALISFCLAFASITAFLFGKAGARAFVPSLVGVLLLGLLAGISPALDWPLRSISAKYGAIFLEKLGIITEIALTQGGEPRLILNAGGRSFIVAAECNGFGLISSSVVLAAILAFHFRLPWNSKLGLMLIAIPLAIFFNAFRIVGICVLAPRLALSYDLIHEGVGLIFYTSALYVLWRIAESGAQKKKEESLS